MKNIKYLLIIAISISVFTASAFNCYVNVEKNCPSFGYQTEWPEGVVSVFCVKSTEPGKKGKYSEAKIDANNGRFCSLYLLSQRCDYDCIATMSGVPINQFQTYRFQTSFCATNACSSCEK